MILVDANILIYAHVSSFAKHLIARDWLDQQLNGSGSVGLPWVSLLAFLRLVTNPRVFEHPEPIGDAWQQAHTAASQSEGGRGSRILPAICSTTRTPPFLRVNTASGEFAPATPISINSRSSK